MKKSSTSNYSELILDVFEFLSSASELCDFLYNIYRYSFDKIEKTKRSHHDFIITLDGQEIIVIFHKDNSLTLFANNKYSELLDKIEPVFNIVMNEGPICKYYIEEKDSNEEGKYVIEWNIKAPETRTELLINGKAYEEKYRLSRITLFDGKEIAEYIECLETRLKRKMNAGIPGLDPGSIVDSEIFDLMDEIPLFFQIEYMKKEMIKKEIELLQGIIKEEDLIQNYYALHYMFYQTTRFGVEFQEPIRGLPLFLTDSYLKWFNFYDHHFNEVLATKQLDTFKLAWEYKQDVSKYLPQGNWQDYKGDNKIYQKER
jgi:hypothetical protein